MGIYYATYTLAPCEIERARFDLVADTEQQVWRQIRNAAGPNVDVRIRWEAKCAHPARADEMEYWPWTPGDKFPLRVRMLVCCGQSVRPGRDM